MTAKRGASTTSDVTLILASASPIRRLLLERAGVAVVVRRPEVDERAIEAGLAGPDGTAVALALAAAKARAVSASEPDAVVIGADQTLRIGGDALHKPADRAAARAQLRRLAGRTHRLHSAVALARGGRVIWDHCGQVEMTMRPLDDRALDAYLADAGEAATASVGAYQVEGLGIRLFERIEGDYFAVLGLPLLPLIAVLRRLGAVTP